MALKYPTHRVSGPRSDAKYSGSGALHDRYPNTGEKGKHARIKDNPAAGAEADYITAGDRSHIANQIHKEHESVPGKTEQYPMRTSHDGCMRKPHGFRCHPQQPLKRPDMEAVPHRFSGNDSAHRIGAKSKTFGHGNFRTAGISHEGKEGVAGIKSIGKQMDHEQGHKAQPKPRKSMKKGK